LKDYGKALESFSQALLSPDTVCQSKGIITSAIHFISASETQKVTIKSSATGQMRSIIMSKPKVQSAKQGSEG